MKRKIYKLYLILFVAIPLLVTSCDEDGILKEVPLDFTSPENSYVTEEDFHVAMYRLYDLVRYILSAHEQRSLDYLIGTDIGFNGGTQLNQFFGSYTVQLTPQSGLVSWHWQLYYELISSANIALEYLGRSDLSDLQKSKIEAEARLFRGLAYRNLAYLYGGVPIELEAVSSPKTDYQRASRKEVYEQVAKDFEFAAQNLPGITEVEDGQLSNLAAYHLLSEIYIALERWEDAIAAASVVIDDPNVALMTERFGSRKDDPGDVYWDLFRRENQNRSSGNTEGIWVFQYELDIPGGRMSSSSLQGPTLERRHCPQTGAFNYTDPSGVNPILTVASDYSGGRGIGTLSSTNHLKYGIWHGDWDDMRNSKYNMVRDFMFNNPESEWYGQYISEHWDLYRQTTKDTVRSFYPYQSKATTPGNHPPELYADPELGTLTAGAGTTYTDQYFIRLAETYLLRAEAHMRNGDLVSAAADINVVRARANAIPAEPAEIDIDYILDERMRELGIEEKRRLTLQRLGLLYDRVSRYADGNPDVANFGLDVQPHHNLWPIPLVDIESNVNATLEQNPGY